MTYTLAVRQAVNDANDSDTETFDELYALFAAVDRSASRRSVEDTWPKRDGIVIASGELGAMKSVTMRADETTGTFTFTYSPTTRNPWQSREAELTEIFEPYIVNATAEQAKKRAKDVRGLAEVMKPKAEGLEVGSKYLPPGVPANIASFLTGEKGSVEQQRATLKKKATGQGRRKSKTRASRRTSLGRKTRRR